MSLEDLRVELKAANYTPVQEVRALFNTQLTHLERGDECHSRICLLIYCHRIQSFVILKAKACLI
jgi:hypothetical protein